MALEATVYIDGLNSANPTATDGLAQGDDHIRLIKSAVKATFPNVAAAVTVTPAELNYLHDDGSTGSQFTGMFGAFAGLKSVPWLRCNGGTFAFTDYPSLGTFLGFSSGTCTLPNMEDTGRFIRSVTTGLAVNATQANALKAHTHTLTTDLGGIHAHTGTTAAAGSHTHTATVTDPSHFHIQQLSLAHDAGGGSSPNLNGNGATPVGQDQPAFTGITVANSTEADHTHTFTTANAVAHTHTGTTNATGDTETRPESYAAYIYIHV